MNVIILQLLDNLLDFLGQHQRKTPKAVKRIKEPEASMNYVHSSSTSTPRTASPLESSKNATANLIPNKRHRSKEVFILTIYAMLFLRPATKKDTKSKEKCTTWRIYAQRLQHLICSSSNTWCSIARRFL